MKASAISINGQWRDVYKDPITDPGKRSKRGRLALVRDDEGYQTVRESELGNRQNELITVYRNGDMLNQITFDEIRARAAQQ